MTDFFGGFSGSYKSKLELIYNEATKELKNKAKNLGANAIVGFSIDFDEVSGSGKSTLLNLIGGLDASTRGSIEVDGNEITTFDENKLEDYRNSYLGFIFQDFLLLE